MSFREERYETWLKDAGSCKKHFAEVREKGIVSELPDPELWVTRHIEKANHNLDFSTLINSIHGTVVKERFPGQTFHDWATVAYYYAIYHAALALLAQAGYRSTSHMATLCGVILHCYHKNRLLEKKHVEMLGQVDRETIGQFIEAQGLRERASYGVSVSFEERLAALARNDAIEFVGKAKAILKR